MIITPYGLIAGFAAFIGASLIDLKDIVVALVITFLINPYICDKCDGTFSLSSFIGIFPIVILLLQIRLENNTLIFNDCNLLKNIMIAMSLAIAIGRIGCYFAGCCTGKPCNSSFPLSIQYIKGSVIVDKYHNKDVHVYPTVLLEVVLQFMLFCAVFVSDYGLQIFGVGQAFILYLTNTWRYQQRPNSFSSMIALFLFSALTYFNCGKVKSNYYLNFKPNTIAILFSIVTAFVLSNDVHSIKNYLDNYLQRYLRADYETPIMSVHSEDRPILT